MGDMLSQAEIDALLGGSGFTPAPEPEPEPQSQSETSYDDVLTGEQKDILGEIGNISMGTAATTLFALLNQKVWITTPKVGVRTWQDMTNSYDRPCVGIRVDYKEGLQGSNVLILKEQDVKIIANLMMGGDGLVTDDEPLSDLELSAIGEAMNQMVGSSSTSLSSMIKTKIDIDTPHAFLLDFNTDDFFDTIGFSPEEIIVCIAFRMEIGTLIDSEIMQILPAYFAKEMVETLKSEMFATPAASPPAAQQISPPPAAQAPPQQQEPAYQQPVQQQPVQETPIYQQPMQQQPMYQPPIQEQAMYQQPIQQPMYQQPMQQQPMYQQPVYQQPVQQPIYQPPMPQQNVNVQAAQFQNFDAASVIQQKENIEIIMDVPLEVTVELGRTSKKIKEILEFSPGSIIELDKLAGEPMHIMVNGKLVARGEVVVIDENFGVRITDIISVDKRI